MRKSAMVLLGALACTLLLPSAFADPPNCNKYCKMLIIDQRCLAALGKFIPLNRNAYLVTDCDACTGFDDGWCVALEEQDSELRCKLSDEDQTVTEVTGEHDICLGCQNAVNKFHESSPAGTQNYVSHSTRKRRVCGVRRGSETPFE